MTLKSLLEKQREEFEKRGESQYDGYKDGVNDYDWFSSSQSEILGFIRAWAEKEKDALILMWGSFDYKDGCKDILSDLINLLNQ